MKNLNSFRFTCFLIFAVFLLGCATSPIIQRLQNDPRFQEAAKQLSTDYLEAQKRGESGVKFGLLAPSFYNLSEYKLVSFGWEWGAPAAFVRIKAGNKLGGNPTWENFAIRFSHNQKLEANGDPYLGLRICDVSTSTVPF